MSSIDNVHWGGGWGGQHKMKLIFDNLWINTFPQKLCKEDTFFEKNHLYKVTTKINNDLKVGVGAYLDFRLGLIKNPGRYIF